MAASECGQEQEANSLPYPYRFVHVASCSTQLAIEPRTRQYRTHRLERDQGMTRSGSHQSLKWTDVAFGPDTSLSFRSFRSVFAPYQPKRALSQSEWELDQIRPVRLRTV